MNLKQIKSKLNENAETVFNSLGMKIEVFGDNIYSICPVHEDSDNPRAFSFSKQKGIWKCWTRDCQHEFRNDIFGLIRGALSAKENKEVNFKDALDWSCELLNINQSKSIKQNIVEDEDNFSNVVSIFSNTANSKTNKVNDIKINGTIEYPSKYFLSRGFKRETLEFFNIGDYQENKGILKDRAIIPIKDHDGESTVGFIGRSIKEYKLPKFLIYPKGFDKRYYFYNYYNAIDRAIKTSCLFILEGQGDVWKLYEHGVLNAVSIFGKSISKEQEEILLSIPITHLIILTDNDQAGRESKVQIKRQLGRSFRLTFPRIQTKDVAEMSDSQIKNMLAQLQGTY